MDQVKPRGGEGLFNPEIIEDEDMKIEVIKITEGLGYGEGSISTADRDDVSPELVRATERVIQSDQILVDVDRDENGELIDDDGCGDGRGVKEVWEGLQRRFKSLNRAKVFGGGVVMSAADEIGSGRAIGETLIDTFKIAVADLKSVGLDFGGHTDDHAHGVNCGCGAIDKAPEVIDNVVKYESNIRDSLRSLIPDDTGLDEIFANYKAFRGSRPTDEEFSGAEVMGMIQGEEKVTKQLEGDHKEWFIILNTVPGKTVNQDIIRQVSQGKLQAFAVDVWRLQEIAEKLHPGDPEAQHRALLAKLIYTLSVAATLTKGDLPVYMIREKQEQDVQSIEAQAA